MSHRILIVEDEAIPALELQMRLERWGYEVTRTEARGALAIEWARVEPPDLVIMDVVLADEVDGIRAADEIQRTAPIPILFVTALDDRAARSATSVGNRIAISKPYNPDELRSALDRLLLPLAP